MSAQRDKAKVTSFLGRLGRDKSGNTFAMVAAALLPIAGVIGSGVDIGRSYMARARLQQACDAGVLAARRDMDGNTLSQENINNGLKLFNFNFPDGTFGAEAFDQNSPSIKDGNAPKVVDGYAKTAIPTAVMKIFGKDKVEIEVKCSSRLDVGNVDVMMVLDVTGSMEGSRLSGLKTAVMDFYNVLGPGGGASGNQIRYGFVPYSSTVNVGRLLDPTWMVGGGVSDTWTYNTRRAIWEVTTTVSGGPSTSAWVDQSSNNQSTYRGTSAACLTWANNSGNNPQSINSTERYVYTNQSAVYNAWYNDYDCYRTRVRQEYETTTPPDIVTTTYTTTWQSGATFDRWEYGQFPLNTYDFVRSINPLNPTVPVRVGTDGAVVQNRWEGCIEERATVNTTSATITIPNGALDMDIDTIPTDVATQWRPFWDRITYDVNDTKYASDWGRDYGACPTTSKKLEKYETAAQATSLNTYVNSLVAAGFTNHSVGMVWGARLLSPTGLFKTENATAANKLPIGRHLVFMTDGTLTAPNDNYFAWGIPRRDGRSAPTNEGNLAAVHRTRFNLLCSRIKGMGITIWVVQFGVSTVSTDMRNCATDASHASAASNNAALKSSFASIAQSIGGLRISE